jgi:hypothetical protein
MSVNDKAPPPSWKRAVACITHAKVRKLVSAETASACVASQPRPALARSTSLTEPSASSFTEKFFSVAVLANS